MLQMILLSTERFQLRSSMILCKEVSK